MKNINYILEKVPHRYPFLMIDKVLGQKKNKQIQTLKNVSINEPFFEGHFPEKPIMPGVLIMESMAQSACLLILEHIENPKQHLVYLSKVMNFRIFQNVVPGDQMIIDAIMIHEKLGSFKFEATTRVGEVRVAKAEFFASLVKK
tara:strand:+ start:881 stop:1312 length:432 start_codon:yes stop_codon:yes gene_type:complete